MNWEIARAYVAGIIDGEGSVSVGVKHRAVRVTNTDLSIIHAYEEALRVLGIQFTRADRPAPTERHKPFYCVSIFGRRNLELVQELVPIQSEDKRVKLEAAVSSFVLPNYYRKHEVTRGRLLFLVAQGLTQREIAEALGLKCHSNAQYHLEKHGLRTLRAVS